MKNKNKIIVVSLLLVAIAVFFLTTRGFKSADEYHNIAMKHISTDNQEEALKAFRKAAGKKDAKAVNYYNLGKALSDKGIYDEAIEANIKAIELEKKRGTKIITSLSLYNNACIFALKGEKEKSYENLEASLSAGYSDYEQLIRDSDLKSLHNEKRFIAIVNKFKLRKEMNEKLNKLD